MPKINPTTLGEVQTALERYKEEVNRSQLMPSTKRTYLRHAETFVRWVDDDFEPGATL